MRTPGGGWGQRGTTRHAAGADALAGGTVEVHLEEFGEHSWVRALASTLSGSYGSAQYRFVARLGGEEHRAADHVVTGATFPVLRMQDLDDDHVPHAWMEIAHARLEELDAELVALGWVRDVPDRGPHAGEHWWSRSYTIA